METFTSSDRLFIENTDAFKDMANTWIRRKIAMINDSKVLSNYSAIKIKGLAKLAGKQFWFSHDPMKTLRKYSDSNFAMELNWLKESYGLTQLTKSNFTKEGSYWCFKP